MRHSYLFAILGIVLNAGSPMAQENMLNDRPAAVEWTGPIVDGHHRQPTVAEVEALERAESESWEASQVQSRAEEMEIEDLYKELMTQVRPDQQNGESAK